MILNSQSIGGKGMSMAEKESKEIRIPEQPKVYQAASEERLVEAVPKFLDLGPVPTWSRNVTEPRFTIPYRGNVGTGGLRCVEAIQAASQACNLSSPTPASLRMHEDPLVSTTLYGVPILEKDPSCLALEWVEQNRMVRCNFQAILRAKQIEIPQGMKMVIAVEKIHHPHLGHCVKLSWAGDCFAPIQELPESDQDS